MTWIIALATFGGALLAIVRLRLRFAAWSILTAAALALAGLAGGLSPVTGAVLGGLWLVFLAAPNVSWIRRRVLGAPVLSYIRQVLPPMSETEREAIDAGGVWWEAELFRGNPHWQDLLDTPAASLTPEEQAFVDGPTDEFCAMLDDWRITTELRDLPAGAWRFLKDNGFFGLAIPRDYGGRGFSATAHSAIVMKIAARSGSAAVTVMVPNSLGPAELLLHYGTEAQKDHYLPRLARGEEIPCFALTGPTAGSDAASIPDTGIVCREIHEGREVLGMRVNWDKRYITLAPVATVVGLAFRVRDLDGLLGGAEDLGITCALIPADTPGVTIGRRHYPMDLVFQNGPVQGTDVFVPLDWVIGGPENIGRGWRMLMESLSVGRGISLPALATGATKMAARTTGAYARVRTQFNLPIGRFEGVQEALARIAGLAYMTDAARNLTTAALDAGERPSVVSAIVKYQNTEAMRTAINDAMDIHGGRGICRGPSNYMAGGYGSVPVTITVEGANILTRSLIIFGQGALRCHPYLREEIEAAALDDREAALKRFDAALFAHLGYTLSNGVRALVYGMSAGRLAPAPDTGPTTGYFRRLGRLSAMFAFTSDIALLVLGGALKRREALSGRFADTLGAMFLCSAALKRFEEQGRPAEDLPLVRWVATRTLQQAEDALDGVLRNFPLRWLGTLLRGIVFPLGRLQRAPDDELVREVAELVLEPSEARDRLTRGLYVSTDGHDVQGRVESALLKVVKAAGIEVRLRIAGWRPGADEARLTEAVRDGVIREDEATRVLEAILATREAVAVDSFETAVSRTGTGKGPHAGAIRRDALRARSGDLSGSVADGGS